MLAISIIAFIFVIGTKLYLILGSRDKTIYEIRVNTYDHPESYMTNEYTKDKESGCINFKDAFGFKHTVCNNYTITEY